MTKLNLEALDIDALLDVPEARARVEEERRLFPVDENFDHTWHGVARTDSDYLKAKSRNDRLIRARAAWRKGEPYEHILNELSQVVTAQRNARLRSQTDVQRAHLRTQLLAAVRRARKMERHDLIHMDWVNDVEAFYLYAGPMPDDGAEYKYTTIDTAGPFAPGNTHWESHDQMLVRLRVRLVEFEGEELTLAEVAKRTGVSVGTLRTRWDKGVRGPDLWCGRNRNAKHVVDVAGVKMTLTDMSKAWNIRVSTLRARLARGLKGEELFAREDKRSPDKRRLKGNCNTPTDFLKADIHKLEIEFRSATGTRRAAIMQEIGALERNIQIVRGELKAKPIPAVAKDAKDVFNDEGDE